MTPAPFPKGMDEKLDLSTPDLWDVDAFSGHKRMAVSRGNTVLENVFHNTTTALPKLIATVRWSVLQIPYKEMTARAKLSSQGYLAMERDIPQASKPHFDKYTRLLRLWESEGISPGVREQLLDLLTIPHLLEAHPEAKDLLGVLEAARKETAIVLGTPEMNAFYHRVGYEKGHETVHRKFRGSFYNTLWQRERTGTIPDCIEVVNFVDTMYDGPHAEERSMHALRMRQGLGVWSAAKQNQYLNRTIEKPLAALLVAIERDLATNWEWQTEKGTQGMTLTAEALQECYGLGALQAERLNQCELVEGNVIEPLAKQLFGDNIQAFMKEWNEAFTMEQERESFGSLAMQRMDERGYTAADLGRILGVKPPEERGRKAVLHRSQRYRIDAEVRRMLLQNHVSGQVSVEALVQALSDNATEARTLRNAYAEQRARYFRRTGSAMKGDGLQMRVGRELASVEMPQLAREFLPATKRGNAKAVRAMDLALQRLERGEGKTHVTTYGKVHDLLTTVAAQKTAAALERAKHIDDIDPELTKFATLEEMAKNLIEAMKGAKFVSQAMRDIARNDGEWLRSDLVTKMADGSFVPSLPVLRTMSKATINTPLAPAIERHWHERFPTQLQEGAMGFGTLKRPLTRSIATLIARKETDMMRFFKDRVPGIVPSHGTQYVRDLEEGENVDWRHIHKMLLAAGLLPTNIPYRLVQGLYETSGKVRSVMDDLLPALRQSKQEIHPMTLPGLTLAELKPFQKKR